MFWHVGYSRHQQQVDLLTLNMVSESRVTWATSVSILVFLGLSDHELGPMYATDRHTDVRRQTKASLNASASTLWGGGTISNVFCVICCISLLIICIIRLHKFVYLGGLLCTRNAC